ncbi:molybdopterin-dependent oxidoreductase alpha subunit [Peribacillus deserti]|uniref:Molybdopterin-dependent oxidoreductase alpha subunit n=1 Tax=Peribacillus deserti TaxID=673318 RepID=A0ABS2QDC1_9BACI|nr:FdhF/YdeP family oxidoreductase [Peribacillus deserti]MBM7691161.1 molybdopterin-dependent oxidoreductase alpha subunit [Peribacillus deserti]
MGKTKHTGPIKLDTRPEPSLWAGLAPLGIGRIKPHHVKDSLKAAWDNKDNLPYAYRILTEGVCDGCALGVSGLRDQTLRGPHVCTTRLNVLRLNTMGAIDDKWLEDVESMKKLNSTELRKLGRIPFPLSRKKGEKKFTRITWDEALNRIAAKIKSINPRQLAFYLTARGITNEVYYTAAKTARFLGTNNIDNASRICHSPSKTALKRSLGIGASSCNYKDWIGTDVLVFWGSVAANNQPVSTKYLYAAKKAGTKIIMINPYREPAMENYWIPSIPESALFGTKIVDDVYQVNIGGDIAFMNGVMKHWMEMERESRGSAVNHPFVNEHTNGFQELKYHLMKQEWSELESSSGVSKERMLGFARLLADAATGVFVWSMGLTQHRFGTDNISQVVNLALLRGFLGREKCGVMPIRGHSGVQGSGEMGADPFVLPGSDFNEENAVRMEQLWGFPVPRWQGDSIGQTLENVLLREDHERKVKLFYTSGGNFLETMPDPEAMMHILESVEMRVHQDIIFNTSTLADAKEEVIILPAMTRYEQPGGGTSTSTERMVYFSPEIEGPRIAEARAEWDIYIDLASRVHPERKELIQFNNAQEIRREIAAANRNYDGIQVLKEKGDFFQWGGAWLCEDGVCPTPDGRGSLLPIEIPQNRKTEGQFYVTSRRGKQFNSMIYSEKDPFNGAGRYDILINQADAVKLRIQEGESIVACNKFGTFQGYAKYGEVKLGNIAVYWPEGNVLLPKGVFEKYAKIPEYNTTVIVEKAETFHAHKDKRYVERRIEELELAVE